MMPTIYKSSAHKRQKKKMNNNNYNNSNNSNNEKVVRVSECRAMMMKITRIRLIID